MRIDCCANDKYCYYKLKYDLAKDRKEVMKNKWLEWERNGHEKTQKNRIFIHLGTVDQNKYDSLRASGKEYVMFTNKNTVPYIKVIASTQAIYQVHGEFNPVLPGNGNSATPS